MDSDIFVRKITRRGDDHVLVKEVTDCTSLRIGQTLGLMPVYEHERDLNKGRFEHFTTARQEWVAEIDVIDEHRAEPFRQNVTAMVNWIAEHADAPWSLDWRETGSHRYLDFSFADSTHGFAFKILFG